MRESATNLRLTEMCRILHKKKGNKTRDHIFWQFPSRYHVYNVDTLIQNKGPIGPLEENPEIIREWLKFLNEGGNRIRIDKTRILLPEPTRTISL